MGCFVITFLSIITFLLTALAVKIAAGLFGFTFTWGIALGVFMILILLKGIMD